MVELVDKGKKTVVEVCLGNEGLIEAMETVRGSMMVILNRSPAAESFLSRKSSSPCLFPISQITSLLRNLRRCSVGQGRFSILSSLGRNPVEKAGYLRRFGTLTEVESAIEMAKSRSVGGGN